MERERILVSLAIVFLILHLTTGVFIFLPISIGLLVAYNFIPPLARILSVVLEQFFFAVGTVISTILLSLIFFLLVTPLGFIFRMGGDKLRVKKETAQKLDSLFVERNKEFSPQDFEKMW